jgi:hypothetical protein
MNIYLIEAILVAVLFGGGAWEVQAWRYGAKLANLTENAQRAQTKSVIELQAKAQEQSKELQEALNAAVDREAKNIIDATSARNAADSLRKQLATISATPVSLSYPAVNTQSLPSVLPELLSDCATKYQGLAEEADRLANSAKTLTDAWPK